MVGTQWCQTPEARRSIENAIWLCHGCSDLVDKNKDQFSEERLLTWKSNQDDWIAQEGGAPLLPDITLHTQKGLTLPNQGSVQIRGEDIAKYREHNLVLNKASLRVLKS